MIEESVPEAHGYDEMVNKLTPLLVSRWTCMGMFHVLAVACDAMWVARVCDASCLPVQTSTYADRVRGYIETSLGYFTSKWTVVRGNAAIFTALIVAHATPEMRKTININTCTQGKKADTTRATDKLLRRWLV